MTMIVEFQNVSFGYHSDSPVLKDINFKVEGPGLVCIIGPNGVGKSTLVKMLCKIIKPTSGRILIDGADLADMSLKDMAKIVGYVPPFTKDFFSLTVIDTVLIGRHNHQKWRTTGKDIQMANRAMRLVGVENLAMRKFNELSAGQHQKVAIARGVVEETPMLILDEPTSNLDVRYQVFIIEMLRALARSENKLIIMICHDLNLAAKYSDQVILLSEPGIVRDNGRPEDVITEDAVKEVYGVDCSVENRDGIPLVVLGSALYR